MRQLFHLRNPEQAHAVFREAWHTIKPYMLNGHRFEMVIATETRNTEQNALLHVLLDKISRHIEWVGSKRDIETWKRLLTAAWLRARGESIELLPAIDGHGVDVVFRRTSDLNKQECAELIDFITAWSAERGL